MSRYRLIAAVLGFGLVLPNLSQTHSMATDPPPDSGKKTVNQLLDTEKRDGKPLIMQDVETLLKIKGKRVNGAYLSIKPRVVDGEKYRIVVDWNLTYDGSRKPLIILEPSLTNETNGQTSIYVIATGKNGKTYGWEMASPQPLPTFAGMFPPKEWYTVVEERFGNNGKSGEIVLVPGDVKRLIRKHLPDEFDAAKPPKLYLHLVHSPVDRAEELGLDAWTGTLMSDLILVELTEW